MRGLLRSDAGYRHVQVSINNRIVDIHLFGGTHGESEHYEKMAKFVATKGLQVPKLTLPKEETKIDIRLLLSVLSMSNRDKDENTSDEESLYSESQKLFPHYEEEKPTRSVAECAERFDFWMKNYNHFNKITDNQELVDWLRADLGAEHIKTYNQFCELAKLLEAKGYQTNPPPTEAEFNEGMSSYYSRQNVRTKPPTTRQYKSLHRDNRLPFPNNRVKTKIFESNQLALMFQQTKQAKVEEVKLPIHQAIANEKTLLLQPEIESNPPVKCCFIL